MAHAPWGGTGRAATHASVPCGAGPAHALALLVWSSAPSPATRSHPRCRATWGCHRAPPWAHRLPQGPCLPHASATGHSKHTRPPGTRPAHRRSDTRAGWGVRPPSWLVSSLSTPSSPGCFLRAQGVHGMHSLMASNRTTRQDHVRHEPTGTPVAPKHTRSHAALRCQLLGRLSVTRHR